MALSEKQRRFCDYYITTANITESAVRAGYSKSYANAQGYKLLENVGIKDYVNKRNQELADKRIASMQEVLEFWANTLRGKEIDADHKDRLKASEFIAKVNGAFIDRVEHSGETITKINIVPAKKGK